MQTFHGKIHKKGWSKSTQSYCAGGSDYFVLEYPSGEEIVIKLDESLHPQLEPHAGLEVEIYGEVVTKVIKTEYNPLAQQPIMQQIQMPSMHDPSGKKVIASADFSCQTLRIETLRSAAGELSF